MTDNVQQFEVTLISADKVKTHIVNCENSLSAQYICEGIYPDMRVVDVQTKTVETV